MNFAATTLMLVGGLFSLAGTAAAQCAIVEPVVMPQVRLDPLDAAGPGELVQSFVMTFRRADLEAAPLNIHYQIVDEDSVLQSRVGFQRGPSVAWQAEESTRDIGALRNESYPLLRSGSARIDQNEQAVQRDIRLRLTNLRDDLPAGIYREQFTVRYWCGDAETSLPYDALGIVAVSVAVPNVLSANIAGASVHGQIDFADFSALSKSLQISVRSTGAYRVSARSLNGGLLLRETGGVRDEADQVLYAATFDGRDLDLETNSGQAFPRAGLLGRQIAFDVNVERPADKRAGVYSDTILLTLAPAN